MLLGEHMTPRGQRVDVQLKGAGPTPYSRRGDGLATLSAMLREYVMGEFMHSLGIPTSRILAVLTTGERVRRQGPQPGAIAVRVASSHLRVGTFEFAALESPHVVQQLTDYAINRHDPQLSATQDSALAFLEQVMDRQAALIAQWMSVGFVHGVMNTDNVSIAGETIDYGPCAFIDTYDPGAVFSSIDQTGRYAFGNQPNIIFWNLCRFAETLLPLLHTDEQVALTLAQEMLGTFAKRYELHWQQRFCRKLGFEHTHPDVVQHAKSLLGILQREQLDFTHTWRQLSHGRCVSDALNEWHTQWQRLCEQQSVSTQHAQARMLSVNPAVIPRNHVIEQLLDQMEQRWDALAFQNIIDILKTPFASEHETHALALPRPADIAPAVTYCGT
jgi:uncharacterized protein YdiU (UPF0061 family)